jgi:hypothetical protein
LGLVVKSAFVFSKRISSTSTQHTLWDSSTCTKPLLRLHILLVRGWRQGRLPHSQSQRSSCLSSQPPKEAPATWLHRTMSEMLDPLWVAWFGGKINDFHFNWPTHDTLYL